MHYTTGEILSVCGSHGSMHDFKIFKKIKNLIKKIIKIPDLIESALINAETRGLTQ